MSPGLVSSQCCQWENWGLVKLPNFNAKTRWQRQNLNLGRLAPKSGFPNHSETHADTQHLTVSTLLPHRLICSPPWHQRQQRSHWLHLALWMQPCNKVLHRSRLGTSLGGNMKLCLTSEDWGCFECPSRLTGEQENPSKRPTGAAALTDRPWHATLPLGRRRASTSGSSSNCWFQWGRAKIANISLEKRKP